MRIFRPSAIGLLALLLAGAPALAAGEATNTSEGTIAAVDADASAIELETASGERSRILVVEETRIMVAGKAAALLDVEKGRKATVTWSEKDAQGKKTPVAVSITVPE